MTVLHIFVLHLISSISVYSILKITKTRMLLVLLGASTTQKTLTSQFFNAQFHIKTELLPSREAFHFSLLFSPVNSMLQNINQILLPAHKTSSWERLELGIEKCRRHKNSWKYIFSRRHWTQRGKQGLLRLDVPTVHTTVQTLRKRLCYPSQPFPELHGLWKHTLKEECTTEVK